jgi:nucleotidyltransferase/DNA polymerase involved in DNA repair
MQTWIAHVELNAFFARCEQRDQPEYRNQPVIVGALPGKRGVVAACSYEARKFGIHSAMPIAHAYRRRPDGVYLLLCICTHWAGACIYVITFYNTLAKNWLSLGHCGRYLPTEIIHNKER